ncbi:BCCT family transporter, partial [Brevibacterium aurantiacum]
MQDPNDGKMKRPIVERERFGGTDRPSRDIDPEKRPPISSTEMSRGPAELTDERGSRVNWKVFIISSAVILGFSIWAMLMPDFAQTTMKSIVDWIATNLGWYYVLTVTVVIAFVLWVALS